VGGGPGQRPGDGELPPDPWGSGPDRPGGPPEQPQPPVGPERSRSAFQHPAIWIGLVVLALVLLVGALLEPSPSPPREPAPDAVTTSAVTVREGARV
jgi:hypothetical protein